MNVYRHAFFTLVLFIGLFSCSLSAEIIEADKLSQIQKKLPHLDKNTLVLFDVDYTLLIANDAILRPCGQELIKKFVAEILNSNEKHHNGDLLGEVTLKTQSSLVDPHLPAFVKQLQSQNVPTIAFTAVAAGKIGMIPSMANFRVDKLKTFGFDFSKAFPNHPFIKFPKKSDKTDYPIFKDGVLFSSYHSKGPVLKMFLNDIQWTPTKVVLIDDSLKQLKAVEDALQGSGIAFTGFHYTAAKNLPCNLDEKVARFQFSYLAKHAKWLNDQQAKACMKTKHRP